MSEHSYPIAVLWGDYLRSAVGVALTGVPAILVPPGPVVTSLLGGLALVFAGFGARTALRQRLRMTADEHCLAWHTLVWHTLVWHTPVWQTMGRRSLNWRELDSVRLAFFATRRRRGEGVMELTLRAGPTRIKLDSNIVGFADIARLAHDAARNLGVELTTRTIGNFQALGVREATPSDATRAGWGRPADWLDGKED